MMKKILILLVIVAVVVAVSGCTESAPETPLPTQVPTTKAPSPTYLAKTTIPTPEPTVSVNDNTIYISRDGFSPSPITVKKGATVRWVNADSTEDSALYNPTHRIKIPNVYTGQTISPGQAWAWKFTETGVYTYQDLVHTDLRGTVKVE